MYQQVPNTFFFTTMTKHFLTHRQEIRVSTKSFETLLFLKILQASIISLNMKYFKATFALLVIFAVSNYGCALIWKNMFSQISKHWEKFSQLVPPIPWVSQKYTVSLPKTLSFYLFTRLNLNDPEVYDVEITNSDNFFKGFNFKDPTKILIHGWMGSLKATFCKLLKDTYLQVGDYNIIVFDWGKEAKKFYKPARGAVPTMGKVVASFIDLLMIKHKMKSEDLHLIGHSLGAHVSGVAGHLTKMGKIGRITGLDPCFPLFKNTHAKGKLTNESAIFVDIIHTCAPFIGIWTNIGHADFYPNYGVFIQPGCGADVTGKCSHNRSYYYFLESIKYSLSFIAIKCDNWVNLIRRNCRNESKVVMGEYCLRSTRGIYYLGTADKSPFGKRSDSINR